MTHLTSLGDRVTPPPVQGRTVQHSELAETRPLRVLLADDHKVVRTAMSRVIRSEGYTVDECADGVEVLETLRAACENPERRYDLVLLDRSMPRMSGTDVLVTLRDEPALLGDAVVAVVSAWAGGERSQMLELGAHAVMPKPFFAADLRELIATHLI